MILTADDITARLHDRPFTPLRLVTTTGQTYDIFHPDLILVGRRFLIVGTPSTDNPIHADQVTRIALVHVAELRDLPSPTVSNNGPPPS